MVGGGVSGLSAAWELITQAEVDGRPVPRVHVLEADDRLGGKLQSTVFAARRVDLAADAFLARRPEGTELVHQLGMGGQLLAVGASGASVWARGKLRTMPAGLNLGVPTRWWPLFRSGILSPAETVRVAEDLVKPHRSVRGVVGDRAVGDRAVASIVGPRLGRPVVERLVDPLVGGINAGGVDDLSAAATFPMLIAADLQSGSLMRRLGAALARAQTASDGGTAPAFWSLADSTASLVDTLAEALTARGVDITTGTEAVALTRSDRGSSPRSRWRLSLAGGSTDSGDRSTLEVDGVVLAVPAPEAAGLLADLAPEAAGILATVEYASVAVVTLALPAGSIRSPLRGTGFLVPRTARFDGEPPLTTGCTYLARKWPHLARPGDELIRVSVGRFGDERHRELSDGELIAAVLDELDTLLGVDDDPLDAMVARWDGAFPQYEVGHLIRVARVEQAVATLGGMAVAGAAYRGVGIPACIASGRAAARLVVATPSHQAPVAGDGVAPTSRP